MLCCLYSTLNSPLVEFGQIEQTQTLGYAEQSADSDWRVRVPGELGGAIS